MTRSVREAVKKDGGVGLPNEISPVQRQFLCNKIKAAKTIDQIRKGLRALEEAKKEGAARALEFKPRYERYQFEKKEEEEKLRKAKEKKEAEDKKKKEEAEKKAAIAKREKAAKEAGERLNNKSAPKALGGKLGHEIKN